MSGKVIYLRKQGTNETMAVFQGAPILENPSVVQIDLKEHEACIAERRKASEADRMAKKEGFSSVADKAHAAVVEKNQARKPAKVKRVPSKDSEEDMAAKAAVAEEKAKAKAEADEKKAAKKAEAEKVKAEKKAKADAAKAAKAAKKKK